MNNHILAIMAAVAIGAAVEGSAENLTYTYFDEDDIPVYGSIRRVSPNGQWATGGDEELETGCFLINTEDPEKILIDPNGLLLDVSNEGVGVGAYFEVVNYAKYKRAAILKNGEWHQLPQPQEILGQSYAISISEDGRVIAGHGLCANVHPDEPGRYFPIVWTLNESTGEYELDRLYNNLDVPGTLGFFVYCMTPDAKYVCGVEPLDFGDIIGVILNRETGELKRFHQIEMKEWYFEGAGGYFDQMFVDGIMDGLSDFAVFGEMFLSCSDRYVYGSHSVVSDVQADGDGVVTNYAAVYDLEEDKFINGRTGQFYLTGIDKDILFTNTGDIVIDDEQYNLNFYFQAWDDIAGIYSVDKAGRVLGGGWVGVNALGEQYESPVLLILDEESTLGLGNISISETPRMDVRVDGRTIEVNGAKKVAIYTTTGMLVSDAARTTVAPGTYIVTADGASRKIRVK